MRSAIKYSLIGVSLLISGSVLADETNGYCPKPPIGSGDPVAYSIQYNDKGEAIAVVDADGKKLVTSDDVFSLAQQPLVGKLQGIKVEETLFYASRRCRHYPGCWVYCW